MRLMELLHNIRPDQDLLLDLNSDEVIISGKAHIIVKKIRDIEKYAVIEVTVDDDALVIRVEELSDLELGVKTDE